MYLNVILTILVIVQIVVCGCVIYWWKKYGKTLFKTFTELKNIPLDGMNSGQLPNMGKMIGEFMNLTKNMSNFK